MEQQVVLYPAELSADVCGVRVTGSSPTELYVNVIEGILKRYPSIIGSKETHFTCDSTRAEKYTGTTRSVIINGKTVYIKTGFSTKDKWKGIEKICQLVNTDFLIKETEESSTPAHFVTNSQEDPANNENLIECYIKLLHYRLEDILKPGIAEKYLSGLSKEIKENFWCPITEEHCQKHPIYKIIGNEVGYESDGKRLVLKGYSAYNSISVYSPKGENTNVLVYTLYIFAKNHYASAAYYLGLCYQSGIIGYSSKKHSQEENTYKQYFLKPNWNYMLYYYKLAESLDSADAAFALGSCFLRINDENNARIHFEKALELRHPNAQIMLRYLKQPKNTTIYNHYVNAVTSNANWKSLVPQEYKGYLYYIKEVKALENDEEFYPFAIFKKSINNSSEKEKLLVAYPKKQYGRMEEDCRCLSSTFPLGHLAEFCYFTVNNDRVYFYQYDGEYRRIMSIGIDGKDLSVVPIPKAASRSGFYAPYATKHGLILFSHNQRSVHFYDFITQTVEEIISAPNRIDILSVTDREVYIKKNSKRNSVYVFDLENKKIAKLQEVYPTLKGHTPIQIDGKREIVYFAENIESICKEHYIDVRSMEFNQYMIDTRLIGINKAGEIVDIWEAPRIYPNFWKGGGYDSFAFNGKNLTCILSKSSNLSAKETLNLNNLNDDSDISIGNTVLAFDRTGNSYCIYHKQDDNICSSLHALTENYVLLQFEHTRLNSVLPIDITLVNCESRIHLAVQY